MLTSKKVGGGGSGSYQNSRSQQKQRIIGHSKEGSEGGMQTNSSVEGIKAYDGSSSKTYFNQNNMTQLPQTHS
jgi:hypothetical protein